MRSRASGSRGTRSPSSSSWRKQTSSARASRSCDVRNPMAAPHEAPIREEPKTLPFWMRLIAAVQTEVAGIHPRLHAYNVAAGLLPLRASGELRARLLRLIGVEV